MGNKFGFFLGLTIHSLQGADYQMDIKKRLEAPIAKDSMTRIYVEGDRIQQVFGLDGQYVLETDEEMGQIFVKPIDDHSEKSFSITILTEEGVTQDLLLKPEKNNTESICLKQGKKIKKTHILNDNSEQSSSYEKKIMEKIKLSLREDYNDFFELLDEKKDYHLDISNVEVQLIRSLQDDQHLIRVFEVKNIGFSVVLLNLEFLGGLGDCAVALNKDQLQPQEKAILVRLSLREGV
jgi:hypothetical protein